MAAERFICEESGDVPAIGGGVLTGTAPGWKAFSPGLTPHPGLGDGDTRKGGGGAIGAPAACRPGKNQVGGGEVPRSDGTEADTTPATSDLLGADKPHRLRYLATCGNRPATV